MLDRRTTVANALVVTIAAVPLVWLIGYQDHRWRNTGLATVAAVLLIGASVALLVAARSEEPPVSRLVPGGALFVSVVALGCAQLWGYFA